MSFSVSYASVYASWTISDYLDDWTSFFVDNSATHNIGSFHPNLVNGPQFGVLSTQSNGAFIAEGQLGYSSWASELIISGSIDTLHLGMDVLVTQNSMYLSIEDVAFSGLDIYGQGRDGLTNQLVQSFLKADPSVLGGVLSDLLDDYGLTTNNTFDEVAAALAAAPAALAPVTTVGTATYVEDLALAA